MNTKKIEFPADEKLAADEITKEVKRLPQEEKQALFYMLKGAQLFAGVGKSEEVKTM